METKYLIRNNGLVGESKLQQQIKEKEVLIKKLASKLNQTERNVRVLISERRLLVGLLNRLIRTVLEVNEEVDEEEDRDDIIGIDIDCDAGGNHVIIDEDESIVPVFTRHAGDGSSDGDVLVLSEQYVNLLRHKCQFIRR